VVVGEPGAGCVPVVPGTVAVGAVTVGVAAVGGWTSGSDFSPQLEATNAAEAAIAKINDRIRLPPAIDPESTASKLTQAFSSRLPGEWRKEMDEELKLGFHRLGQWFEDPVNMGVGAVVAWVIVALPVAIALSLSPGEALLVMVAGVAVALLLRRPIELAARRWRQRRLELERERDPASGPA